MRHFYFIALIFALSIVSAHAEMVEQSKSLNFFSGPVLFQDLDRTIAGAKIWVLSIAFLILSFGVLGKIQSGDIYERGFMKVVFIFVAMIAMANSGKILEFSTDAAAAFSEALGLQPSASFAEHILNIERTLAPPEAGDLDHETAKSDPLNMKEKGSDWWSFFKFKNFKEFLYQWVTDAVLVVMTSLLWVCGWIITIFETARYFLLKSGALLLPLFIAGLMTRAFGSQSVNYIFGLLGIVCWPIGWAIGNLGTNSLFAATGRLLRGDLIVGDEVAAQAAEALSESIANGVYNEASMEGIQALSGIGLGTILCVVLMLILTCLWAVLVTIMTPKFMSSLFSSGADMFSGAMGAVGSMAGGAAGSAVGSMAGGAASTGAKMAAGAGQAAISPVATVKAASAGVQAFGVGARAFGATKLAGAKEVASFGARTALNTTTMPQKATSSMLKAAQSFNKRAGSG